MGLENPPSYSLTDPTHENSSTTVEPTVLSIVIGAGFFFGALCLINTNESNNYINPT